MDAGLASAAHLQVPHQLLDRPGDEVGRGAGNSTVDHHDSSLDEHASVGDLPRDEYACENRVRERDTIFRPAVVQHVPWLWPRRAGTW